MKPKTKYKTQTCIKALLLLVLCLLSVVVKTNGQESPIQIVEDITLPEPPQKETRNRLKKSKNNTTKPYSKQNEVTAAPFEQIRTQTEIKSQLQTEEQIAPEAPMRTAFISEQNIILPLNIIGLQFEGASAMSSTYGEAEAMGLLSQLNLIYKQYGIEWKLNNSKAIKLGKEQYQEVHFPESLRSFTTKVSSALRTSGSGSKDIPTVYVTKNFPNGADEIATKLNIPNSIIFAEKSQSTGKGNPNVLAHELGHILGLTDIPKNDGNLMSIARPKVLASTKLYAHQLSLIRKNAKRKSQILLASPTARAETQGTNTNASKKGQETKSGPTIFRQIGAYQK